MKFYTRPYLTSHHHHWWHYWIDGDDTPWRQYNGHPDAADMLRILREFLLCL